MPHSIDPDHDFASRLTQPEAASYWQLIGQINKLPADDEMRLFKDVLAFYAKTALREAENSTERVEKAKQEIEAMVATSRTVQERIETLLITLTDRLAEKYELALTAARTKRLMDEALTMIRGEFVSFLNGLSVEQFRKFVDETERGKQALKDTVSLSENFRQYMSVMVPRVKALTQMMVDAKQQMEAAVRPSLPKSKWEQHWPTLAIMTIFLVGTWLAFLVGRHTASF